MSKSHKDPNNALSEAQDKLEKFLQTNNLIRQAQIHPELSFSLPNISKSLLKPKKNESFYSERLSGELQFLIATISKQPEWPELVAEVQPITNINIETLIVNVNSQVESPDKSSSNSGLSISDQIGLVNLFITLYPHIDNEQTRAIAVSILTILHAIFAKILQP